MIMTRNRSLGLLALPISLFLIGPLAAGVAAAVVPATGSAITALFAMFWSWALLALLLGRCIIGIWARADRRRCRLGRSAPGFPRVAAFREPGACRRGVEVSGNR